MISSVFPNTIYKRSDLATINQFREILMRANINCITRKTRGEQIDAACGQLVGQVKDRTRRVERLQQKASRLLDALVDD